MNKKILFIGIGVALGIFLLQGIVTSHKTVSSQPAQSIHVGLSVGTTVYPVQVLQGRTVYDVMTKLASTTAFQFTSRYFSGLGYFVDEIDGVKNQNGTYWTLYVNGVYATVGVSQYIVKNADIIQWRYEKK